MVTIESKGFSLVLAEGKGNHGGWLILAEKLRSLRVVPIFEEKKVESSVENGGSGKVESGSMSYVNAVRKNEGLAEETAWLQIGEGDVQDREEKLRRCLIGKFGEGPFAVSNLWALNIWARGTWQLRYGLQVSVFRGSLLLFEFED